MYLSDFKGKSYNLEFMRFLFAIMVILNHSFPLSTGNVSEEWMVIISRGQMTLGTVAVAGFFLCGGYFTAKTVTEKRNNMYPVARLRRLIPELSFVVAACIILGAFITALSPGRYFLNGMTWKYLLNAIMIPQHDLPGVFENNIYTSTVNGALWTLPVEYLCNLGIFILWKMKLLDKKRFIFTLPLSVAVAVVGWKAGETFVELRSAVIAGILFYIGTAFYMYREHIYLSFRVFIFLAVLTVILFVTGYSMISLYTCFPYLCFYVWMNNRRIPDFLSILGEYSYALYLWGFPVQQTVVYFFGGSMSPYLCFAIATPLALALALLTHRVILFRFSKFA